MNNKIKSLANGDFEVVPLDDPKLKEFEIKRNYHYSNTDNPIDFPMNQGIDWTKCTCHTCLPISALDPTTMFMRLCPTCGNKRCPKATNHDNACTNSNEPNQPGSCY
jgi:hypothetical protein